jgi:hypothetical protein
MTLRNRSRKRRQVSRLATSAAPRRPMARARSGWAHKSKSASAASAGSLSPQSWYGFTPAPAPPGPTSILCRCSATHARAGPAYPAFSESPTSTDSEPRRLPARARALRPAPAGLGDPPRVMSSWPVLAARAGFRDAPRAASQGAASCAGRINIPGARLGRGAGPGPQIASGPESRAGSGVKRARCRRSYKIEVSHGATAASVSE